MQGVRRPQGERIERYTVNRPLQSNSRKSAKSCAEAEPLCSPTTEGQRRASDGSIREACRTPSEYSNLPEASGNVSARVKSQMRTAPRTRERGRRLPTGDTVTDISTASAISGASDSRSICIGGPFVRADAAGHSTGKFQSKRRMKRHRARRWSLRLSGLGSMLPQNASDCLKLASS